MATEYWLITWAGKGTTVTFTDAGDIVNLTAHGAPAGHAIRFSTTGALPTGLTAGTLYYLGPGADANKFLIYPTSADAIAGTNQITFSGTGSGTNQVVGDYWYSLPATDPGGGGNYRARYGSSGSERVYGTYKLLITALNALSADYGKDIYVEFYDKFTEYGTSVNISNLWKSVTLASFVNGVRSPSFHHGIPENGYVFNQSASGTNFYSNNGNTTVDGLQAKNLVSATTTNNYGILLVGNRGIAINNIVTNSKGIVGNGFMELVANNIAIDCVTVGFAGRASAGSAEMWAGNLATGCLLGFDGTSSAASFVGNIAVDNTTNWGTAPTNCYLANNIGESGDTVWGSGLTTGSTSMFLDYANGDYSPASASAVQVNLITPATGDGIPRTDINDAVRPNYESATYPTNLIDAGPFEYDNGDGLAPASSTMTISANVTLVGAEIRIYDLDLTDGTYGTELSGVESCTTATYVYEGLLNNSIHVQIMKDGYVEYNQDIDMSNAVFTLTTTLIIDTNA